MNLLGLLNKFVATRGAVSKTTPRQAGELGFALRVLSNISLPRTRPKNEVTHFHQNNGKFALSLKSHTYKNNNGEIINIGLPFGSLPRLLLCYVASEAVKTKSRTIPLGNSLSDFMRELGLSVSGGVRGDIGRLHEQSLRLFSSSISVTIENDSGIEIINQAVADSFQLSWHQKNINQKSLWESEVVLSEQLYQEIIAHPVPLDMRVLRTIKGSSLRLDIYTWLVYRTFRGKGGFISWDSLEAQFGSGYKRQRDFKTAFRKQFAFVCSAVPELSAKLSLEARGLKLIHADMVAE